MRAQVERSGPRTFDEAYALALREQQIFQRCTAQKRQDGPAHKNVRGHESMEIDHSRRVITIMTIEEGLRVSNAIINRMKGLGARTDDMTIELTIDQGNGESQKIKAN